MNKPKSPSAFGASTGVLGMFGASPAQQAQATLQKACALHQQGELAQARPLYEQVLKLQPKNFDALHLLGVLALQDGDAARSVDLITQALKIDRHHAPAYNHRGAAYAELKDHDMALLNYGKAIECDPLYAEARNNRANVLSAMGRLDDALNDLDRALSLNPRYVEALNNRGNVLADLGRHEEARDSMQRALEVNPGYTDIRWRLGMASLRLGDFFRGWQHSEARLNDWVALGKGQHAQPRWTGQEPLEGKTILVQSEQGLGDSIQFARYLPMLARQAGRVVFEVQKPVLPLLTGLEGIELVAEGDPLPAFDCHCRLLSLPMAFRTDLSNIPPPTHIHVSPVKVEKWQRILGPRTRPRVGLVWSGNASHVDDRKRSMTLADLLPLLPADIEWVSLHKDVRPADARTLAEHPGIRHFAAEQEDFSDAAAMCELLDLVISVDTSLAHLAGSMGKPLWIMLANNPDWRWLLGRSDSPWYPSANLYRQPRHGDWASVVARIKADLGVRFPLG